MNALEQTIVAYQKKKWILISATSASAQLRKPKGGFSCLPGILMVIVFIIPGVFLAIPFPPFILWAMLGVFLGILDFILYALRRDKFITLFVNAQGMVIKK